MRMICHFHLEILFLILVATLYDAASSDSSTGSKFNPQRGSLLRYLDTLSDMRYRGNSSDASVFTKKCKVQEYDHTVYHRLVYLRLCEENESATQGRFLAGSGNNSVFNEFCDLMEMKTNNTGGKTTEKITNIAEDYNIFGPGITSDLHWLAQHACADIRGYYKEKQRLNVDRASIDQPLYPNYTEWFFHTIPFALPVACGFTKQRYESGWRSANLCLPQSYTAALYATFAIDSILLTAVVVANLIILRASWNIVKFHRIYGCFRVSLAISDLLIGAVIGGVINTTYTMYFGPHKFTEDGHLPTILDYHSQSYVDGFGAVNVLSFSSSIFTLVVTSFERFLTIYRPFSCKGHQRRAGKATAVVIVAIWALSFVIAIIPVFNPSTPYTVTALGVILAPELFVAYLVFLGTSLLGVWGLNIGAVYYVRQHIKKRRVRTEDFREQIPEREANNDEDVEDGLDEKKMRSGTTPQLTMEGPKILPRAKNLNKLESRVTATVRMVVCAFTACIMPGIAVMISTMDVTLEPSSKTFNPEAKAAWNAFAYLASRILFANSFFNCVIYKHHNRHFFKYMKLGNNNLDNNATSSSTGRSLSFVQTSTLK
ncbi:unnamed protein product [Clavelina lepadiformis]|uniref:G-protein coupled receptors family 1 profile domain-containing protein n=1 Tax=Clavelina lepadiformis TaxID=159417 RepID=A0ABP0FI56_CLALP